MKTLSLLVLPLTVSALSTEKDKDKKAEEQTPPQDQTPFEWKSEYNKDAFVALPDAFATLYDEIHGHYAPKKKGEKVVGYTFGAEGGAKNYNKEVVNGPKSCVVMIGQAYSSIPKDSWKDLPPAQADILKLIKGGKSKLSTLNVFEGKDAKALGTFKYVTRGYNVADEEQAPGATAEYCNHLIEYWHNALTGSGAASGGSDTTELNNRIQQLTADLEKAQKDQTPVQTTQEGTGGKYTEEQMTDAKALYTKLHADITAVKDGKNILDKKPEEGDIDPENDHIIQSTTEGDHELIHALEKDNTLMIVAWVLAAVLPILVAVIFMSRSDSSEEPKDDEDEDAE